MGKNGSKIPEIIKKYEKEILADWMKEQMTAITLRADLMNEAELSKQSTEFINLFQKAAQKGNLIDISAAEWVETLEHLGNISRSRAMQGFTSSETATFIFSLKQPLFTRLRLEAGKDPVTLSDEIWNATVILDKLGLYSAEFFLKSREDIIRRQAVDMMELSTPVVKVWEGILALPLIGTLDSARTQVVMEALLKEIMETGSTTAILDITGVPAVDTLVAQHLMKTVSAARLMGAECIISGIRPQIAQTIVHLGVTFQDIVTKATMAEALSLALKRSGFTITRKEER